MLPGQVVLLAIALALTWTLCGHKSLSKYLLTGNIVEGIQVSLLVMERSNKDIATKY